MINTLALSLFVILSTIHLIYLQRSYKKYKRESEIMKREWEDFMEELDNKMKESHKMCVICGETEDNCVCGIAITDINIDC